MQSVSQSVSRSVSLSVSLCLSVCRSVVWPAFVVTLPDVWCSCLLLLLPTTPRDDSYELTKRLAKSNLVVSALVSCQTVCLERLNGRALMVGKKRFALRCNNLQMLWQFKFKQPTNNNNNHTWLIQSLILLLFSSLCNNVIINRDLMPTIIIIVVIQDIIIEWSLSMDEAQTTATS